MSEQRVEEATKDEDLADYLPVEHGHVDHASLGRSLHQIGFCLSEMGDYGVAKDWYGRYPRGLVRDPQGPKTGGGRVLRGGCWGSFGELLRSAFRDHWPPGGRDVGVGFRLAADQVGERND